MRLAPTLPYPEHLCATLRACALSCWLGLPFLRLWRDLHNSVFTLSNMRNDILTATTMSKARKTIEATELSTMPKMAILRACDFLKDTVPRTSPTPIMRVVIHTMIPADSND